MALSADNRIFAQLRDASTPAEQIVALRALKNEIIGHPPNKEAWVRLGVLDPIVQTILSNASTVRASADHDRLPPGGRELSQAETTKLQALHIIASFAYGGARFLAPLHAAGAISPLLANICPKTNPPQIVVAALRSLNSLASSALYLAPVSPLSPQGLADLVFVPEHIASLVTILSIDPSDHQLRQALSLAAELIQRLCLDDQHRDLLIDGGILDVLATRLASVAVAGGHVVPGADKYAMRDGLFVAFPEPAPPLTQIGPILDAITAIIGRSKYRAHRFINAPSILAVFPAVAFKPAQGNNNSEQTSETLDPMPVRPRQRTAMDYLLPDIPSSACRSSSTPRSVPTPPGNEQPTAGRNPPHRLGSSSSWGPARIQTPAQNSTQHAESIESPVIPWLILALRSGSAEECLAAAALLAALFKADLGARGSREVSIGLHVIPILVDLISKSNQGTHSPNDKEESVRRRILERGPDILAYLITDNEHLQMASYNAYAAKVLAKLLNYAYEPAPSPAESEYWSPNPDTPVTTDDARPSRRLGETREDLVLAHHIKVREAALRAVAALAAGKEEHRKALVKEDLVPCVVESLEKYPRKPRGPKDKAKDKSRESGASGVAPEYGLNPASVVVAACHVVRTLSRAVSVLRTVVVDHGVALPILNLMKDSDVDIQIAAVAAMINLVIEVSPVRELLTENGVMRVLCEHAHSDNPNLRLNAVWALKHFVDAVGPELKKACLEELSSGWLQQLICDDIQDTALQSARAKEFSTNRAEEGPGVQQRSDPHCWFYSAKGSSRELKSSDSPKLREAEKRLLDVQELETNPERKARNEDLAIQEQGLDFIRNLIGRPRSIGFPQEVSQETTEMIDYLFSEMGQDRLFHILETKVRPKTVGQFGRPATEGGDTKRVSPPAKIMTAAIYVLVHISASSARHRQLVIAQSGMLKHIASHTHNKSKEVRVALCHLIINLTSQDDDESEAPKYGQRAHELKRLGFHARLDTMSQHDSELDVRERAKTATWQMEEAMS